MSNDFMKALKSLNNDRGIPVEYMIGRIQKAIITACKNIYGSENVSVELSEEDGLNVKLHKLVVEKVENPEMEISLSEAKLTDDNIEIGQNMSIDIDTTQFGRVAAQTARNIIRQGIKDNERDQIINNLKCNEGQIVSAKISRINPTSNTVLLKVGDTETTLLQNETMSNLIEGEYIKVYVVRAQIIDDAPGLVVSRTCSDFVKKLFELEVPEILDGSIEIKAIVREAGSRTKMAVKSNDPNVDPIGSCVGAQGSRIKEVLKELKGEKIDIIRYYEEPEKFIESALAPAQITGIEILTTDDISRKACKVFVCENQLSLAIGIKGQNVRLASKITGWKLELESEVNNN